MRRGDGSFWWHWLVAGFLAGEAAAQGADSADSLLVAPPAVELAGPRARQQLLASVDAGPGGCWDRTREATWASRDPSVASVTRTGLVVAEGDGQTEIIVRDGSLEQRVAVTVRDVRRPRLVDFHAEIVPLLSRAGCNQGTCHGAPHGKDGFRLSVRGSHPEQDLEALTRDAMGRRIDLVESESSLLLRKPSGRLPHEGGVRFLPGDSAYRLLRTWIEQGARASNRPLALVELVVLPGHRRLHSSSPLQHLVACARFADGSVRDVTDRCVFESSQPAWAQVDRNGLVTFHRTAAVTVVVRYLEQVTGVRLTYVRQDPAYQFAGPSPTNEVDRFVFAKQRELQLVPADPASEAAFLRRVHLDLIGIPPTVDEARAFLDATEPEKRTRLVDRLLERDEFAAFWALKWADVLRGNREAITQRGVHSLHRYLVDVVSQDRPIDQLARELMLGLGNTLDVAPANFYRINRTPETAAEATSQLFLGLRIQCARCHNHPYESLSQEDYYGVAAFFAEVARASRGPDWDDEIIYRIPGTPLLHPKTGLPVAPRIWGQAAGPGPIEGQDLRRLMADWVTSSQNPYFARAIANRIWFHLMGRGLVEPPDDLRATNPASIPELLDALAEQWVRSGYRIRPVIRTIVGSTTYALSAEPKPQSPQAADPAPYFTHAVVRMLSAEQLLDAIAVATGLPEDFEGYPPGTLAIELAEGAVKHDFLKAFSKAPRDVACECGRESEPTLGQLLHLVNNPALIERLDSPASRLAHWRREGRPAAEIVDRLYLATLSRWPTAAERRLALSHIHAAPSSLEGLRDLQHALLNTNEFLLRH